eukprot:1585281-Pyramimonas_sp.AAC.1
MRGTYRMPAHAVDALERMSTTGTNPRHGFTRQHAYLDKPSCRETSTIIQPSGSSHCSKTTDLAGISIFEEEEEEKEKEGGAAAGKEDEEK